jgi:hypothetical protein
VIDSGGISTTTSPSGSHDRAVAAGGQRHLVTHARLHRERRELDPGHEPAAADLRDRRKRHDQLVEQRAEQLDLGLQPLERALDSNTSSVASAAAQASGLPV